MMKLGMKSMEGFMGLVFLVGLFCFFIAVPIGAFRQPDDDIDNKAVAETGVAGAVMVLFAVSVFIVGTLMSMRGKKMQSGLKSVFGRRRRH